MSEKNVPNVRFEGFSESWEQRQLGKIVDERKERSSQGELLSVTMHDGIKKSSTLGKKDNSSDNKSNYKVVCQGDIAYNSMRMWQGASGLSMFNGIVSPAYTVLKIGTSIDGSFLSYLFKRSEMIWMFRTHSQGLTSDTWNLKYPALSKIKIEYPILNEQIRISTFLKNFDQLIASNQHKLDQLKEVKKLLMQKIFDQEWRFEGFTDPWEQRKFKKLYRKNTEKNEYQFTSDKTISIATMAYKTEGNGASDKSVPGYKVLRVGDIAFEGHKSKEFSFGRFVLNDIGDGIMSPRFTALRPLKNTNIQFWKYYIHYEPIMKKVLVRSTKLGTMMNELVLDDLFKQNLLVPSNLEQEKIGALLKKIDLIIASNQQKLDQLKELKKWFMQNMFV